MKKRAPDASSTPVPHALDRTDRRLLLALQEDATRSDEDLAKVINLSPSGCRKRRHRLEEAGVIQGYVALVDQSQVGFPEDVIVGVKLRSNDHDSLAAFDEKVKDVAEVMDCRAVTGEWDYILWVVTPDMPHHDRICEDKLTRLPGVERLVSFPAMRHVVHRKALPIRP